MKVSGLGLAILLLLAVGCRDGVAPLDPSATPAADLVAGELVDGSHILQQSPTAPPLATYQVSFWASKDRASGVAVNYQPQAGQATGDPFLRFDIPEGSLRSTPDRRKIGHDSVLITLTIDPQNFTVDFQPSGLVFSRKRPAILEIWYNHANPDFNGDGVVDAADQAYAYQLSLWTRPAKPAPWQKLISSNGGEIPVVYGAVPHFSEAAVSW